MNAKHRKATGRLTYVTVAVAAIVAGVAPWALGLGRQPTAVPVPQSNQNWTPPGHAYLMIRVGSVKDDTTGKVTGGQPAIWVNCGAFRDTGNQWTVREVAGDNPCPGWNGGYSYILTTPTTPHTALWSYAEIGGLAAPDGDYIVKAYIPNKFAGALTEYAAQYCGTASWQRIGVINQDTSTGWTAVPGTVHLSETQPLCAIRETSTGTKNLYLAEDALEVVSS